MHEASSVITPFRIDITMPIVAPMTTARYWHQHPGVAVRWALLLVVLAAHAAVLWFWPIGRPQAVVQQITPVRVVMVDEGAAPRPLAKAAIEAPQQQPAAARQLAAATTPQDRGQTSPLNAPQAMQQAMQQAAQAAQANALAPPPAPASTQVNAAPTRSPSGESAPTSAAAVSPTGAMSDTGNTGNTGSTSSTGARVDGSTQTSSALPWPGIGAVAAAPSTPKTMKDICPHTVKAVPPARATQAGLGGMVLARATIQGGKVRRVDILRSEPGGLYDAAVRTAMAQYICRDQGTLEVLAEQLFEFKVVE